MNWSKIQEIIGEDIPNCVKTFLSVCAYDTFSSIQNISSESIIDIERHMNTCPDIIANLDCCHSDEYKKQRHFKLLLGHRDFLLSISKYKYNASHEVLSSITRNVGKKLTLPVVLQAMVESCEQNSGRNKYHVQYNDLIRYFSTYTFLSAGRSSYEFLRSNLDLPSTKTVLNCIENNKSTIIEGKLRCQELSEYLINLNAVKSVWISEDATACIPTIKYDPKTNQLVGILLPTNNTGCPIPFSFLAKDADTIGQYITLPKSKFAYVIIAQALDETVPPFILQMFGTGVGSFKSHDVLRRWDFTIEELEKYGIEVVGASSDGDTKLLAAMCGKMCGIGRDLIVTQDHIHLGNKCRNRMLKQDVHLPMGKFEVSIKHLQSLVMNVQKSVHGLSQVDVCPIDRMNYDSFEKVTRDRTIESLQKHIKNSDATIQYLKVCRDATMSYMENGLTPIERIKKIWHALFFFRIWRSYVTSSTRYTLGDNFLTTNAYMCVEINARNLIRLIKKFRDANQPEHFLPGIFDSQGCENIFRLFRSMGTTQYTKINFSLYELMHMIRRVETLNDIAYVKLAEKKVNFPNKRTGKAIIFNLPSDEEIDASIAIAKSQAIENAATLGMSTTNNIDEFEIRSNLQFDEEEEDDTEAFIENTNAEDEEVILAESDKDEMEVDETSRFVIVHDENGAKKKILKSTLIWMLTEPRDKISNDRLRRVQVHNDEG
ncbi:uncharacterized protein LOC116350795 [Contarinia nasturtii]|uniref:uncharacterized protein LOC116350795 n=1 Tax=Contarinia nasturtii TaxID=265458 RepID=UPI0012D4B7F5|nr:uncharacterized protein LOC116350795 [Contarinia nasturtii]